MPENALIRSLRQVRLRLTAVRAVECGERWAVYGAALAAALLALSAAMYSYLPAWYVAAAAPGDSFFTSHFRYPAAPLAIIPLAFLFGAMSRLLRPVTLREAAIYLDGQAGLEERVATAYELTVGGDATPVGALLVQQATEICQRFRPGMIGYSRRLATEGRHLLVAGAVCLALLWLPPYQTADHRERAAVAARARAVSADLRSDLAHLSPAAQGDPELQRLLAEAERVARTLSYAPGAREQSLADLESLRQRLEARRRQLDEERRLASAAAGGPQKNPAATGAGAATGGGAEAQIGGAAEKAAAVSAAIEIVDRARSAMESGPMVTGREVDNNDGNRAGSDVAANSAAGTSTAGPASAAAGTASTATSVAEGGPAASGAGGVGSDGSAESASGAASAGSAVVGGVGAGSAHGAERTDLGSAGTAGRPAATSAGAAPAESNVNWSALAQQAERDAETLNLSPELRRMVRNYFTPDADRPR